MVLNESPAYDPDSATLVRSRREMRTRLQPRCCKEAREQCASRWAGTGRCPCLAGSSFDADAAGHCATRRFRVAPGAGNHRLQAPSHSVDGEAADVCRGEPAHFRLLGVAGTLCARRHTSSQLERLHEEVRKMLTNPKVLDTLDQQGIDPFLSALDQIPGHLIAEQTEIARLVKAVNIKMD